MRDQKFIKWGACVLFIICLGQALYIYFTAPFKPDPVHVVSVTEIAGGGAIYEILYDSGGATVPIIYRYFLMAVQPSEDDALKESMKTAPFLVTQSTEAVRGVSDGRVKLITEDRLYEFHNIGYFKVDGELNVIKFDLTSTIP